MVDLSLWTFLISRWLIARVTSCPGFPETKIFLGGWTVSAKTRMVLGTMNRTICFPTDCTDCLSACESHNLGSPVHPSEDTGILEGY